jgi:hypothetical protein
MSDYSLDLGARKAQGAGNLCLGINHGAHRLLGCVHSSKHTVIGDQIDNEVRGIKKQFPASLVVSYTSGVASAVK